MMRASAGERHTWITRMPRDEQRELEARAKHCENLSIALLALSVHIGMTRVSAVVLLRGAEA